MDLYPTPPSQNAHSGVKAHRARPKHAVLVTVKATGGILYGCSRGIRWTSPLARSPLCWWVALSRARPGMRDPRVLPLRRRTLLWPAWPLLRRLSWPPHLCPKARIRQTRREFSEVPHLFTSLPARQDQIRAARQKEIPDRIGVHMSTLPLARHQPHPLRPAHPPLLTFDLSFPQSEPWRQHS